MESKKYYSVGKADAINSLRDGGVVRTAASGGEPIRKRGYYRALKRGEYWAVLRHSMNEITKEMFNRLYVSNPIIPSEIIGLLKLTVPSEDRNE